MSRLDDDDSVPECVWTSGLAKIVECCPNVTSLRLYDPWYPDYRDFLANASSFAPCLTSLELDSPSLSDDYDICCDHLLPQFVSLTHLTLGDGTLSASLPAHLRQVPLLTSLCIGPEAHWNLVASDFFTLLEGPTQHPSLRNLFFGCFGGRTGHRIGIDEEVKKYLGMTKDGWQMPSFHEEFTELDCRNLRGICASNRIVLSGDATWASDVEEEYNLEEANRSVLRCLQLKSLDDITCGDGSAYFDRIPVDNLDPQNLKLVKTEIPEKNWFRLSLE